jgi:excinuclease ABC subunit A
MDVLEGKDPHDYILIKGARTHNLRNVDVAIPRNKLVVVTGLSGSGKSSLTMDTLYAEGQRRYVESLSSYARQFLTRMNKPDVDYIKGIAPAIAIEQRVTTGNNRSTVGTMTEIYDYLRLLYAKVGVTYSPISGERVVKHEVSDVMDFLNGLPDGIKGQILIPFDHEYVKDLKGELRLWQQKGFIRCLADGQVYRMDELLEEEKHYKKFESAEQRDVVIDRFVVEHSEAWRYRVSDSINLAFQEGNGYCGIDIPGQGIKAFSNRFELDGIVFEEPNPQFFNFNSPYGACPTCEGFGHILGIDEDLVFPDRSRSVYQGAVAPWKGESMGWWKEQLIKSAASFDFPIHKPVEALTEEQYRLLWTGNEHFSGLSAFFRELEEQTYKIQYRVMLSRYRGRTRCTSCLGSRLRPETNYVRIGGQHLGALLQMPVKKLADCFDSLELDDVSGKIASRLLQEIQLRLKVMIDVGLDYLTLNRVANTLSGGETQRIHLTRMLGSNLTGSLYLLDEPSIGLHPHDINRLVNVLKHLRNLGNTVIVVEHEESIIRNADHLVDVGPEAGANGGNIVFSGTLQEALSKGGTLTTDYLQGKLEVPVPKHRRKSLMHIELQGGRQHNLKNVDVKIPLQAMTVVSGVSGSGKTTLIKGILYPALKISLEQFGNKPGNYRSLTGDLKKLKRVEMVDQNPIGRSSRSNPVTYIKAYDAIRDLYAAQNLSKIRGYQPKHFSFNVDGGRCEACKGEGEQVVEMQFLADVHLTCESCGGKRFQAEILEVEYKEKNIADVLELTVEEAILFFSENKDILYKIQPLADVGLGYVQLGQSSSTLSGGEAQRVKLASFLTRGQAKEQVLFIFDEPTTGLHFHDVNTLLIALNALIEAGHTVVVIEHNLDVIKSADWVIDLGPVGGEEGGYLLYQGVPEGLVNCEGSKTGEYLKEKMTA